MSCAAPLVERGVNIIGVPKTIDNDIVGTEITFGFLTAYEIATRSLDRLHSTAASHSRVMVCEVMGRNAGWIALYAGTASGSDVILMPEIPFDIDIVARYCEHRAKDRHGFTIICCSEGARPRGGDQSIADHDPRYVEPRLGGIGESVAAQIQDRTGIETRTTVLGHVQRGGTPVAADRVLATRFGHHALQLLMSGETGRMVVRQNGAHTHINILDCAHRQRLVDADNELVSAARAVRTCFGDSR